MKIFFGELGYMHKNNDYFVYFMGAKLNRLKANRAGVGIVFGIIGSILTILLPFGEINLVNYGIIILFVLLGYFVVGPIIFKDKK